MVHKQQKWPRMAGETKPQTNSLSVTALGAMACVRVLWYHSMGLGFLGLYFSSIKGSDPRCGAIPPTHPASRRRSSGGPWALSSSPSLSSSSSAWEHENSQGILNHNSCVLKPVRSLLVGAGACEFRTNSDRFSYALKLVVGAGTLQSLGSSNQCSCILKCFGSFPVARDH